MKEIKVAAGVIRNTHGEIFIARRQSGKPMGDYWEFPGGKIEAGETPQQALTRELEEEVGIVVRQATPLIHYEQLCQESATRLHFWFFLVEAWQGEPWGKEGQPCRWVSQQALQPADFPATNAPVLDVLLKQPQAQTP